MSKIPQRPHLPMKSPGRATSKPGGATKSSSGPYSRRRRQVVDPTTLQPVGTKAPPPPTDARDSSAGSETPPGSDTPEFSSQQQHPQPDTALLDRLQEQEFLRRHARNIRLASLIGVLAGLLVVGYVLFFSPLFAYQSQNCQVNETKLVETPEICAALESFEGRAITSFPLSKVRERVLHEIPELEDLKVARSWPRGLRLQAIERIPVATVRQNGKIVGVDREAVVLEVAPGEVSQLPILDVELEKLGGRTQRLVTASLTALADMPSDLRNQVAKVTSDDPLQLSFQMRDERQMLWGDAQDSVRKATVAQLLFTVDGVKIVDVSNPDRPSTR